MLENKASATMIVIPIEKIQEEVGKFYDVSVKEMKGTRRVQNIVLARQVAMYLARELTDNSLPKSEKNLVVKIIQPSFMLMQKSNL